MPPRILPQCPTMVNPTMFFDITVDGESLGRISFSAVCRKFPKTAENVRALSTGEKGFGYEVSYFHRIIPRFMCQGGDFTCHSGTGGQSIYGEKSDDENFILKLMGVLASCPWQMLAPTQTAPSFSSALPRLSGWMASVWSLARRMQVSGLEQPRAIDALTVDAAQTNLPYHPPPSMPALLGADLAQGASVNSSSKKE
ncbi:hypothetical protein CB1_002524025 [Camelus ferus]|nr:hypothetical protein CB1_002524025 [Camelus ferus]